MARNIPAAVKWTVFDPRIQPIAESGCWIWIRGRDTYGYARAANPSRSAHREFFRHLRGPIPDGLVLDHVCRERSCVNPDHLRLFTRRENAIYNSTSPIAANAAKTACSVCGGPFVRRGRRRHCRRCNLAAVRRYKAQQERAL